MARLPRVREGLTLEEFLRRPEIDEHPYLEYIDGRIEAKAKVSPQKKHSRLATRLITHLNQVAEPAGLGSAFVELRCTFAGRSIVPDVVFLLSEHILADKTGEIADETPLPPDIHIEIISPKQGVGTAAEKLLHATANGCPLGWLIHPYRKTIDVYRPGRPPERLAAAGVLEGEPVPPGFRLPAAEVFGWLIHHQPGPGAEPA
ncbi:MAG TPA: Uma2 family endonuclease [Isosphaeraceae bacterium]